MGNLNCEQLLWQLPNYSITQLPNPLRYPDFGRDPLGHERLNHIALFDVIEVRDVDAAFHAVADFAGIILEPLERADLAFVNLHAVAHQANVGIAFDDAVQDITSGHGSHLGDAESLAYFGAALIGLLDDRLEQSSHRFFDLVLEFVDDRVQADIDLLHLRQFLRLALGTNVEADDHCVRRRGQQHIVLGNRADSGVQDLDLNLLG